MDIIKMGRLIRHARTMRNMTQEVLAERVGVSTTAISNYENGRRLTTIEALMPLCRELELLPTELFSGKRIQDEEVRTELLSMLYGQADIISDSDEKSGFDFSGYSIVTTDRKGRLTDVWIPYEDDDLYTHEEIYSLQEKRQCFPSKRALEKCRTNCLKSAE